MTELHRLLKRNMKRLRLLLGISQAELARRAGLSPGYVGEVETGRKFPSPERLEAIALALDVRAFRLLMGPEDVTDALGPDAAYETAERLRKRLDVEIEAFVRDVDPKIQYSAESRPKGKPPRGR